MSKMTHLDLPVCDFMALLRDLTFHSFYIYFTVSTIG